jgi:hypothetical protein
MNQNNYQNIVFDTNALVSAAIIPASVSHIYPVILQKSSSYQYI